MWKAIWWGLAGIPLGFVFGGLIGVVAATVIVAMAGAVNWRWHMCEPRRGIPVRACAVLGGAVVVVVALHALLPFLLPLAAVVVVLAVVSVPLLRLAARRLTVPKWSARYGHQPHVLRARARAARAAAAATPRPRAIEAPRLVVPGVVLPDNETTRVEA